MSDTKEASSTPSASAPKGPLLLALVNTLAIVAALGTFYATKVLYRRPTLTEEMERKKLEAIKEQKRILPKVTGTLTFPEVTANLKPTQVIDQDPIQSYLVFAFTLEIRDSAQVELVEKIRPILTDRILAFLNQKTAEELNSVQGRYLFRSFILNQVNELTAALPTRPPFKRPKPSLLGGASGEAKKADEHAAPASEHGAEHSAENKTAGSEASHAVQEGPDGPPVQELYPEGLATQVFFSQFTLQ